MTYNFDIEQWWEREYDALRFRLDSGEMDSGTFDCALQELQDRYDEMGQRLDNTFRVSKEPSDAGT